LYLHLLLAILCLNVFLPLMTIEGTPFYNPDSCYYNMSAPTAPSTDPAYNMTSNIANSEALLDEIGAPTNSTDGTPWDLITQAPEALYKSVSTAVSFVMGGYVTKFIDHVTVNCVIDEESGSVTEGKSIVAYKDKNPNSPTFGTLIKKWNWDSNANQWVDNTCGTATASVPCYQDNPIIEQFKIGFGLINTFLITFLVIYLFTGRGFLVTS